MGLRCGFLQTVVSSRILEVLGQNDHISIHLVFGYHAAGEPSTSKGNMASVGPLGRSV